MSFSKALQLCQKETSSIVELQELRSILQSSTDSPLNSEITGDNVRQLIKTAISSRNLSALQLVHEVTCDRDPPISARETSLSFAIQERWLDAVLILLTSEKGIIGATDLHLNALAQDPGHCMMLTDLLVKDKAGYGVLEYAACARNLVLIKSMVSLILNSKAIPEGVSEAFISAFPQLAKDSTLPCTDAAICSVLSPLSLRIPVRSCHTHSASNLQSQSIQSTYNSSSPIETDNSAQPSNPKRGKSSTSELPNNIVTLLSNLPQCQQSVMTADIVDHLLKSNNYAAHVKTLINTLYGENYNGSINGTSFSASVLYRYLTEIPKVPQFLNFYTSLLSCTYPNFCLHYIDFELYVFTPKSAIPSEIGLVKTYKGRPVYALQGLFLADVTSIPKKNLDSVVKITGIEYDLKKKPWCNQLSYTDWTKDSVRSCINWFLTSSPQALDQECAAKSILAPVTDEYILSKLSVLVKSFEDNAVKMLPYANNTVNPMGCTLYKHISGLYIYQFHVNMSSPLPKFPQAQVNTNKHPKPFRNASGKIIIFGKGIDAEVKSLKKLKIPNVEMHEVQQFFSPFVPMQRLAVIAKPTPSCAEPYCVDHEIVKEHTTRRPSKGGHFHCALYDALQLSFCVYKHLYQIVTPDLVKPKHLTIYKNDNAPVALTTITKAREESVED